MAIIGAILGDIAGSRWEFHKPDTLDWKNIPLFTDKNSYTDDTVLTVATKYALDHHIPFEEAYVKFARRYPDAGYGTSFYQWMKGEYHQLYGSAGNGSAMRVSPIADHAKTTFTLKKLAKQSSACTHNDPEAIKAAYVTARCIQMAKKGASKEKIEKFGREMYPATTEYRYPVSMSLEEMRETHYYSMLAKNSVPVAIRCFLDSDNYESFLRNVISLYCDCDTICAIGGGIAEEYYHGTGLENERILHYYLPEEFLEILKQ